MTPAPQRVRLVEITLGEASRATRVYLSEHGIDLSGEQQTETRTALEFFPAELAAD